MYQENLKQIRAVLGRHSNRQTVQKLYGKLKKLNLESLGNINRNGMGPKIIRNLTFRIH